MIQPIGAAGVEPGQEIMKEVAAENGTDPLGVRPVAVRTQQHQTQVGIVLREAVQLRQVGEGADLRVCVGVLFAHEDQTFRHLVLQPLEQVTNVLVVDVERAAVDVRPLRQLPDGDGLGGLFRHEIHQSLP